MKLYYFIHLTGRDPGNSGIQRVVRNLGAELAKRADIQLLPVRWCAAQRAVVHADYPFKDRIRLFNGPVFGHDEREGQPIHLDADNTGAWLLIPEAPHLGSHDAAYPPVHLSYVLGYVRRNGLRSAAIFHDILPISHFGKDTSDDPDALKFIIYANALSLCDRIIAVSRASKAELLGWFARNGIAPESDQAMTSILLPEEMIGIDRGRFVSAGLSTRPVEFCMWGSIHLHKNQAAVLEAFNDLCERRPDLDLRLHLFGHIDGRVAQRVAQAVRRSGGRIQVHGFMDDRNMWAIIGRCRATIFLSLAEGYGLPVAESLWLGKPCLTSNIAPMTEIAEGGGCALADPSDRNDMAGAIERLATTDILALKLQNELVDRNFRTWSDYAAEIAGCLSPDMGLALPDRYRVPVINRPEILSDVRIFTVNDLYIPDAYVDHPHPLRNDGEIDYNHALHGSVEETTLIYGPYIDLPRGHYAIHLDASLRGEAIIRASADSGKVKLGEWVITDGQMALHFHVTGEGRSFEVVIKKMPGTHYLTFRNIYLNCFV